VLTLLKGPIFGGAKFRDLETMQMSFWPYAQQMLDASLMETKVPPNYAF
jgi:hypothetical protein